MDHKTQVTVLMPVYNAEQYLREAIESILGQTHRDFEFLIIDDGSTDQSGAIINSYYDPRIRAVPNGNNFGLIYTLNRGLDLAQGELIARMDADDISQPERLARQVAFLNNHVNVGVCGSWIEWFMGRELIDQFPVNDREIKQNLPYRCPFAHPAVMLRAAVLRRYRLRYDPCYPHAEDYELWTRLASLTDFANLPEVLLKYRIHPGQICRQYLAEQAASIAKVKAKMGW